MYKRRNIPLPPRISCSMGSCAVFFIFMAVFLMSGCCGHVNLPETISNAWQGSVWKISISQDGEGLFEGLLACGNSTGPDDTEGPLSLSLIDPTGITLMKLDEHEGRLKVTMALPPFNQRRVADYIESDLTLILYSAGPLCNVCRSGFLCTVEEYPCQAESSDAQRCVRAVSGPFELWDMRVEWNPNGTVTAPLRITDAAVTRPWSGMRLRLVRLE